MDRQEKFLEAGKLVSLYNNGFLGTGSINQMSEDEGSAVMLETTPISFAGFKKLVDSIKDKYSQLPIDVIVHRCREATSYMIDLKNDDKRVKFVAIDIFGHAFLYVKIDNIVIKLDSSCFSFSDECKYEASNINFFKFPYPMQHDSYNCKSYTLGFLNRIIKETLKLLSDSKVDLEKISPELFSLFTLKTISNFWKFMLNTAKEKHDKSFLTFIDNYFICNRFIQEDRDNLRTFFISEQKDISTNVLKMSLMDNNIFNFLERIHIYKDSMKKFLNQISALEETIKRAFELKKRIKDMRCLTWVLYKYKEKLVTKKSRTKKKNEIFDFIENNPNIKAVLDSRNIKIEKDKLDMTNTFRMIDAFNERSLIDRKNMDDIKPEIIFQSYVCRLRNKHLNQLDSKVQCTSGARCNPL